MVSTKRTPTGSACIQMNGTNMQTNVTDNTLESVTTEISGQSQQQIFPITTYSVEDSLVKHLALLEKEVDLTTPEGLYFMRSHGFLPTKDPDIYYSKTSKVYYLTTLAKLSKQYLGFSPTLGMTYSGRCLTQKTLAYPKTERGCLLSDNEKILDKYLFFL